jgi:hypothetical protein
MSSKWRKSRAGRLWHREYMRNYMRKRKAAAAANSAPAPAKEPEPVEVRNLIPFQPAESRAEKYRRDLARPKAQKPMFDRSQIIGADDLATVKPEPSPWPVEPL